MTKFIDQETYGRKTLCKCPKCGCKHALKMRWIGRGIPWKFCGTCSPMAGDYDHIEDNGSAPWGEIRRSAALS
jgi:hypothetical protein